MAKITRAALRSILREMTDMEFEQQNLNPNPNSPAYAELDIPDVLIDGGKLLESMHKSNLDFRLIAAVGPGGGVPLCLLKGRYGDLFNWITTYHTVGEPGEARDLIVTMS